MAAWRIGLVGAVAGSWAAAMVWCLRRGMRRSFSEGRVRDERHGRGRGRDDEERRMGVAQLHVVRRDDAPAERVHARR